MGSSRLELPTSRLSGARSNLLSYEPAVLASFLLPFFHGDDGIRTHDPLLAGQVLSQLSYTPISSGSLKIEQQHSDPYLIPSWYSNQPFSLERR